ncbi:hypothetical protein [Roseococcus thiosulfatophilus]|uniref:hypothetical protein n=1 Tax=Roseococcus thiosulfatophilus TaxID=35813 RepID=UPI001F5D9A29|nr:hypothetical protein [Roseococcus thiosulfatophilus]
MTYDMNDAELPRGSDLIPDGSFVKVIMHLRKGGLDGRARPIAACSRRPRRRAAT